jgi:hypothetical protein
MPVINWHWFWMNFSIFVSVLFIWACCVLFLIFDAAKAIFKSPIAGNVWFFWEISISTIPLPYSLVFSRSEYLVTEIRSPLFSDGITIIFENSPSFALRTSAYTFSSNSMELFCSDEIASLHFFLLYLISYTTKLFCWASFFPRSSEKSLVLSQSSFAYLLEEKCSSFFCL